MDTNYSTERLNIRDFTIEDAPFLQECLGDKDVARQTMTKPHPFPESLAVESIEKYHKFKKDGAANILALTLKDTNQFIGLVGMMFKPEHKKGDLGYLLSKPFWGKGYATEAAKKMLEVGFNEYGLERIAASAFADNPASLKVLEKVGFRYEGTSRKDAIKWGEARDVAFYGILKEEYEEKVGRDEGSKEVKKE